MNTPRRRLAGLWIATVAIGAALLTGGLGFADWGNEEPHPGPMGPGMGAFHCPMWGEGRSAGTRSPMAPSGRGAPMAVACPMDSARDIAEEYLTRYGDSLEIAEILEFSNHFYVQVRERDTDRFALELLVTRDGRAIPEPGPNMRWNARYAGMGARHYFSTGEEMPISLDEAVGIAQAYLDQVIPGAVADPEVAAFYGYYTVYVLKDGQITGMLSVNGFTGQVWPHSWHGEFLGREEK